MFKLTKKEEFELEFKKMLKKIEIIKLTNNKKIEISKKIINPVNFKKYRVKATVKKQILKNVNKINKLPIYIAIQITYNNLGTILNFILENSNITLDKIEVIIDKKTNFIIKIEFWQYGFQKNELSENDFLVLQPDKWFKKYEYFDFFNKFSEFEE